MGEVSKVVSIVLRVWEIICASVVTGIVSTYVHYVQDAHASTSSQTAYAVSTGAISIFFGVVLLPPLKYSFWAFALDFALFVMWMVVFGLFEGLTGSSACNSVWYWNHWGWYWGNLYLYNPVPTRAIVGTTGCAEWRTMLAFSFMGGWTWLISACLGVYVTMKRRSETNNYEDSTGLTHRHDSVLTPQTASSEEKALPH